MSYELTISGPAFSLDDGYISHLSYGNPERVVSLPLHLFGSYAEASSGAALWDVANTEFYWQQAPARCVKFGIVAVGVSAGTRPYINIWTSGGGAVSSDNADNGLLVDADSGSAVWTTYNFNVENLGIEFDDYIDIAVLSTDDAPEDTYLTVFTVWVLE